MSKKKRSKILATLLCATTMAAFYVSPQIGYAVDLYYKTDGSGEVVINGGDGSSTNEKIEDISGIASITFGTPGVQGKGGVMFYLDAQEFGGVRADGAFTANDLYIMVDPKGEGTERYSLRNVMGIYRNQDDKTGEYATSIESGTSGGGMQITNDTINMLDGTIAISTEKDAKYNISFDGTFNSEQGMTVGKYYTLDAQGNITTTGDINGNEISENKFNDVTLYRGEVIADEVTVGDYELSDIGERTAGIISYRTDVTTFDGTIASDAIETSNLETRTIRDGEKSFNVETAADTITLVNDTEKGLAKTYEIASTNKAAIENEITGLGALNQKTTGMSYDEDSQTTTFGQTVTATDFKIGDTSLKNVADAVNNETSGLAAAHTKIGEAESEIDTLQKVTTGMSYDASSGTTFSQAVTANDFKIAGGTSLSQVASELTTAQGKIQTNTNNITTLTDKVTTAESEIGTLKSTTADHGSRITANTSNITALTGRVTTAEGKIDTLQTATTGMSYNDGNGTTFNQVVNATDFKVGDVTLTGVAADVSGLKTKTHGFDDTGETLELTTINSTTGTIGSVTFTGGTATGLTNIAGDTVTVAGTAIGNGSFNGVTISNYTSNGSTGAKINGISIYQDTDGHYNVGTIDLNDLTGSGSIGTVDGIVRTDNTPQDKEDNDYTTTIEGNLEVRTDGTITQRNGDFAVSKDGTVTGKDFVVKGTGTTLSGVASNVTTLTERVGTAETNIGTLQTTVGDESSGLVKNVNDLKTTVSGHTTSINELNIKTKNLSEDGMQLTGMDNIESAKGTIGGISFDGKAITNVTSIGADTDTINIAGTPISKGSFNSVSISNYTSNGSTGATINGISIYKDTNSDYIVGDVNISDLQGVSGTEIKGIKRTDNTPDVADDNNFTTTIEENLAVSTDGTIKQTKGAFAVDTAGAVTGKDFVIDGGTSLSTVAHATTGMTYTPGNTTSEGVTSFDHNVHATNFTTDSADLNKLSETVGNDNSGLVKDVNTLETKTQGFSDDGKNLNLKGSITANTGTIGNISFSNYAIGTDSDTITVAGTPISKGSFNGVGIKYENSNYWVGDVNLSELKANAGTVRGITYTNGTNGNYTMNFAEGAFSVSTTGEFTFNYNGKQYGLDKLINTVDTGDLEDFQELKDKVKNLEDKTTGIEFNEETGSTTITDMNKNGNEWEKGDNSLTVGDGGITANGDTVINGDTDDNITGGNGNGSSDPQGGDSIINGDQLVNGDQHVTGDSQFDGTVTVGTGTDGKGQTVIDGGTINTGNTVIDGVQVKADEGHFGNITVGEDDNQTTIGDDGIKVGDNTTIDNSGVSIKDENGNVFMGDHDVVIKDSDGNVEASLSDVANRVDGIEQSIGDLNSRMGELEDRIDKVGAMAAAIANLRTMGYDPAAPTEVAVGIGQYRNETGAALGLFHYPNRDFMLSLSVSTSGDEVMGGIGATWKFGRKSPEKVAAEKAEKAREAKLQKAEAIKEAARLKKIEAQQERHAKLAAQKTATK